MGVRIDSRVSRQIARKFDKFLAENCRSNPQSFKNELGALEATLIKALRHPSQVLEVRRRCAELYLSQTLTRNADWKTVKAALKALERRGYSNVERRTHFAVLLGTYSSDHPEAATTAKSYAQTALEKVRHLRQESYLRRYMEPRLESYVA